jgi:glycosyltransferase involved in cell wall biosynthesis
VAEPELVLVDDGLTYGGGQLGLGRYLRQRSARSRRLVLLAPNQVALDAAAAGVPTDVLQFGGTRHDLPRAWLQLLRRHLRRGTEVVIANSLLAGIVVAATPKRGRRFVYYMREDFSPGWITGGKYHVVRRLVFPRFDGFVANSSWTGSTLPPLRRPRRVELAVPLCGVDAADPPPPPPPAPALRVLSLSRITAWKGVDLVMDAAIALADTDTAVELTLAGAVAPDAVEYDRALRTRDLPPGLHVTFAGHVDDVDPLLASHDVLVVASRHPEPFGQVVIQGLAWGLSVVASRHGGPVDVLADEPLGHLVTPDDASAIAEALARIAVDPPSRRARLETARRARLNYRDPILAAAFERAVEASLGPG